MQLNQDIGIGSAYSQPELVAESLSTLMQSAILWLDAAEGYTITGSGVSLWEDKSPNGYDLSMAVDADRPGYDATGGPNSKPAVVFDLANTEYLQSNAIVSTKTQYTIVAALDVNNPLGTDTCLVAGSSVAFCPTRSSQVGMVDSQSWLCGAAKAGSQILTWVYDGGVSISCYRDGVLLGSAGSGLARALSQVRLGAYTLGLMHCGVDLSEIAIFARILTAAELAIIHAYVKAKFNL
jgi:hypothetical protein